jgi:hypothetical protein
MYTRDALDRVASNLSRRESAHSPRESSRKAANRETGRAWMNAASWFLKPVLLAPVKEATWVQNANGGETGELSALAA